MAGHGRATSTGHAGCTVGAPLPLVRLVAGLVKVVAVQHARHRHQRGQGRSSGPQAGRQVRPRPSHQHGACGLHGRCPAAAGAAGGWPGQGSGDPARQAPAPMKAGQWLGAAGCTSRGRQTGRAGGVCQGKASFAPLSVTVPRRAGRAGRLAGSGWPGWERWGLYR